MKGDRYIIVFNSDVKDKVTIYVSCLIKMDKT
jgi:hypothetical protein